MSAELARAILAELDDAALDALAELLAPRLADRLTPTSPGGWLDARGAAEYLGISLTALHRLTAARAPGLKFSQERPGPRNRCYFRRSDLDAYREQFMRGR